jgi:LPXTG-site transpeptidase (sortase) family protein
MPSEVPQHRAKLDENGNIVLPGFGVAQPQREVQEDVMEMPALNVPQLSFDEPQEAMREAEEEVFVEEEITMLRQNVRESRLREWSDSEPDFENSATRVVLSSLLDTDAKAVFTVMTEEAEAVPNAQPLVSRLATRIPVVPLPGWTEIRGKLCDVTSDFVEEGGRQYQSGFVSGKQAGVHIAAGSVSAVRRFWKFLAQPVWVPGRKSVPKKRTRGALFVSDVFRFGGTFASLFGVLFIALNYQSFWSILEARLDPLSQADASGIGHELANDLTENLKHVPTLATAGQPEGDLLSFLPTIGPPENRLIIPKLNLNVPIIIPSNDALMREDWKALEEDIQGGLQRGVVHYPGTAKPGQAGNFFLTGHSSYFPWDPGIYKSVFARLGGLNPGDEYWVYYGGDKHRYIVQERKEVKPSDVTVLDQPLGKRISTLMTCTPVGTTLRRLIIRAQEVDIATGKPLAVGEHETREDAPQHKLDMLPI